MVERGSQPREMCSGVLASLELHQDVSQALHPYTLKPDRKGYNASGGEGGREEGGRGGRAGEGRHPATQLLHYRMQRLGGKREGAGWQA